MSTTGTDNRPASDTDPVALSDIEGFRTALQQLIGDARRHLRIYSQSLARPLYNEAATVQLLSDFARSSRYARVQILIVDSEPLLRRPHRIPPLVQRLGSRMELRKIQAVTEPTDWEFALADSRQVLVRSDNEKWRGQYHHDNPVRARQLQDVFEQSWLYARPDPELKRFFL